MKKLFIVLGFTWSSLLMAEELVSVTFPGPVISAEAVRGHPDELA